MTITLANLKDATTQQVFDQVRDHLLKQQKRSVTGDRCLYRSGNNKCAAGCLIADDEYNSNMDSGASGWHELIQDDIVPSTHHDDFIVCLQEIHDVVPACNWSAELTILAKEYNLEP